MIQEYRQKVSGQIVALPKKEGENRISTEKFQRKHLQCALQNDIVPDILTNHVRYSEEIESTMPKAKFLTIIRDPVEQFISAFYFFHKESSVLKSLPITEEGLLTFLEDPHFYQKKGFFYHFIVE